MKKTLSAVSLALVVLSFSSLAMAEPSWQDLNAKVTSLYQQGKFTEALPWAKQSLNTAENNFGANSPETALALNNLAMVYKKQNNFVKAEQLYTRALNISEKLVGPSHPDVTVPLNNLALLYAAQKDYGKAFETSDRAVGILEKAYGPNHPNVATALEKYAAIKRQAGKTVDADALDKRAAKIRGAQKA